MATADGFEEINQQENNLVWEPPPLDQRYFGFKWRSSQRLVTIFKSFIPPTLLTQIIDSFDDDEFLMSNFNPWHHIPTISEIYIILAICIRIQAIHNSPQSITRNDQPLRNAIKEAKDHFSSLSPSMNVPGINIIAKLISLPLFNASHYELISNEFKNQILQLGESVAGDEKLFKFTGLSRDLRLVPAKPGKIGFWNYQLVAPLQRGGQFLVHTNMAIGGGDEDG